MLCVTPSGIWEKVHIAKVAHEMADLVIRPLLVIVTVTQLK
jgi:hypothetical protein